MVKIREIVQINSGYTSYVDLFAEYYDLEKNRVRMERYKPITAHRLAFEKIASALNPLDRRFYFLSGSYGTGKSHLLLMLANYFANPSDVPEIEAFFKNYETAQNEVLLKAGEALRERKAQSLKEARKSGRFLVAICRYSLNLDFEGTLLRALEEALKREDADILLDSHYAEAVRRIRDWEARRNESRFFADLEAVIHQEYPDWSLNDLLDGLEKRDHQAMQVFRACFRRVTDTDFAYSKDNLRDILSDLLQFAQFKERYQGVVFLYDEFGSAIDANLVDYRTLLDFAQFCAASTLEKGGFVIFVGTGHKAFRSHGKIGDLNAETLEARVTEIGLQTQGMEDIIGAIVQPKKDTPEWQQQVEIHSQKFTWFSSECNRLRLFNWLPAPKIKNNIIQNIYPLHPLATFALLRLAGEAGSDTRSVFKFFAPEFETGKQGWINVQPYSYPWFVENHEVIENGKLSIYTPDLLVEYFAESLKPTNTRLTDRIRNAIVNYETTLQELNAYVAREQRQNFLDEVDELTLRILKVMLVNEIASTADVPIVNTAQNIEFALDFISYEEKTLIENRLSRLCEAGILYNNHGVYEFLRSERKDVRRLVDQYKANPSNRPTGTMELFIKNTLQMSDSFLEAKDYNSQYGEDKRLKVIFAEPSVLSAQREINVRSFPYFASLEYERLQNRDASKSYEGVAVYVFCENETEIDMAKKAVLQNDQQRVVVAIPRSPIDVFDAVFTLKALESDWFRKQAENFGPHEKAEENRIRSAAKKVLDEAKQAYFNNTKVYWFAKSGIEIPVRQDRPHDVANWLMRELYETKRNAFPHKDFNRTHVSLTPQLKNSLKDAGDILCDLTQPIRLNWTLPENRGSTKYLRRCFVDHQALRILSAEGDIRYLEAEKDHTKFRHALPAYANMLENLASLEGKPAQNVIEFLEPYFEEYGQGEIALTLMLLMARRVFGDSLRFKSEPQSLTDIKQYGRDAGARSRAISLSGSIV